MKKVYQLTSEGKADLAKELVELKERRVEISERIAAARDYGMIVPVKSRVLSRHEYLR